MHRSNWIKNGFVFALASMICTSGYAQLLDDEDESMEPKEGFDLPVAKPTPLGMPKSMVDPLSQKNSEQNNRDPFKLQNNQKQERNSSSNFEDGRGDIKVRRDLEQKGLRKSKDADREDRQRKQKSDRNNKNDLKKSQLKDKFTDEDEKDLGEFLSESEDYLYEDVRSKAEEIFLGKFPQGISKDLEQFGYDLFRRKPSDFVALEDIPISPDYTIGPGDTFTINVWGSSNFSYPVTVRRDGTIFIPKVGSVRVWGQTFKEMSAAIEKRLLNFFSGIKVNIAFDSIRQIDVYVVGEVKQPGSYSIPSTSTPINALFHAGGPTKDGSLRSIQILRNNKVIDNIDLYDFLINGMVNRLRLQSQDVILVPVVGKMVAIAGNVKRPAIYELKDKTSLYDLLAMSGNLTFAGQVGRLSLDRVNQNKERITKDFQIPENFAGLSKEEISKSDLSTEVLDGDLVKVFPVLSTVRKTVFLRGHVKRPGSYEFKEGMTFRQLVRSYDDIKPEPYTDYAQIIRSVPPTGEKLSIFVELKKAMDGDAKADIALQDRDEVVLFSKEELNLNDEVTISGKVNKPGNFIYFKGMKLRDLIYVAGNITQDAYLANAEIARYIVVGDDLKLERIQVNLRETLNGNASQNPELKPRDKVFVMSLPNWKLENFVSLTGEVRYPGQYPFLPGEKLSSVIERAGGYTNKAFLKGAFFTRKSVQDLQRKALKEQISQLEEAVLQETVRPSQYLSADDLKANQEAIIARKGLLTKLQSAEVTGRMVIKLDSLDRFRDSEFNIPLEARDTLDIPEIPSVVTIMGEVYSPSSMVYVEGQTVQYYLSQAGGATVNADTESIFVIRANGSVVSKRQNRGFLLRNFYQTEIERGDAILVPKDITRFSWLNTTKDITEILFKIASTTGITITALK